MPKFRIQAPELLVSHDFLPKARRCAFTLVELLIVIAIIGVLAAMLLSAISRAKARGQTASCLNNLKQLQLCWQMYAEDNEDVIPPNNFVYQISMGATNDPRLGEDGLTWCRGLAPLDTNEIGELTSLLFRYNRNVEIYHCPADRSTVSGYPDIRRKRSYNMSNSANCRLDNHFRKNTAIPSPASLFVFIDTHEDAIWDSTFGVNYSKSFWKSFWLDVPADRHQQGANVSFADGHAEHWRWRAPKRGLVLGGRAEGPADLADLRRLQNHIKGAGGN